MIHIYQVPPGKFCRIKRCVGYIYSSKPSSIWFMPVVGFPPSVRNFKQKVYVYRRIKQEWITICKERLAIQLGSNGLDNLTYIENLAILKSYGH